MIQKLMLNTTATIVLVMGLMLTPISAQAADHMISGQSCVSANPGYNVYPGDLGAWVAVTAYCPNTAGFAGTVAPAAVVSYSRLSSDATCILGGVSPDGGSVIVSKSLSQSNAPTTVTIGALPAGNYLNMYVRCDSPSGSFNIFGINFIY
jgi:hypothetical protein